MCLIYVWWTSTREDRLNRINPSKWYNSIKLSNGCNKQWIRNENGLVEEARHGVVENEEDTGSNA